MPLSKKPSKSRDLSHFALWEAATNGNTEEVARLIRLIDAKEFGSRALKSAVVGVHMECVRLLIPVSDVSSEGNLSLSIAVQYKNKELFDLLYPHSDHALIQEHLKKGDEASNKMQQFIAQYEKSIINNNLSHDHIVRPTKKM